MTKTITQFGTISGLADGDELLIWDVSTSLTRKVTASSFGAVYALLAGRAGGQTLYGGTAANEDLILEGTSHATRTSSYVILQSGGGAVVVGAVAPATSATLDVTGSLAVKPAAGVNGIIANANASAAAAVQVWQIDGVLRAFLNLSSAATTLALAGFDNGANGGPSLVIDRNSNVSTPAGGNLRMTNRGGSDYYIWVDASANIRTGSSVPSSADDTSGVVVGTQTSSLDSKIVCGEFTDYDMALRAILSAPLWDFTYKNGSFNGEQFTGIITDHAPVFGMDRDDFHPGGKSLNIITAHGYTMAAIKALDRKIEALAGNRAHTKETQCVTS